MVMTDCAVYVKGKRTGDAEDLKSALSTARAFDGGFVWLGLAAPEEDEVEKLAERLSLPHLAVEDVVHAHQRPKLELYGDTVFGVVKPAAYDDDAERVLVGEMAVFLGDGVVFVVEQGGDRVLTHARSSLERQPGLLALGPATVVHGVLDHVVDGYAAVLEGLQEDVDEMESVVFSPARLEDSGRVYRLKREVLELRRAVTPLRDVLARFAGGQVPHVPEGLLPYFRDVHDHVLRHADRVEALDQMLDGLLDATLAKVTVQQNADQRKISAWAGIALVPTVVGAIYGMNFERMPELEWRFGYPLALGFVLLVCVLLYRGFRRNGWL